MYKFDQGKYSILSIRESTDKCISLLRGIITFIVMGFQIRLISLLWGIITFIVMGFQIRLSLIRENYSFYYCGVFGFFFFFLTQEQLANYVKQGKPHLNTTGSDPNGITTNFAPFGSRTCNQEDTCPLFNQLNQPLRACSVLVYAKTD